MQNQLHSLDEEHTVRLFPVFLSNLHIIFVLSSPLLKLTGNLTNYFLAKLARKTLTPRYCVMINAKISSNARPITVQKCCTGLKWMDGF